MKITTPHTTRKKVKSEYTLFALGVESVNLESTGVPAEVEFDVSVSE